MCQVEYDETCDTCPEDCTDCSECGDGYCDPDAGEDCDTCPEDCSSDCPTCGDGQCVMSDDETCDTCPEDCGACDCVDFPDVSFSPNADIDFDVETPAILGTGVSLTVGGHISGSFGVTNDTCEATLGAGGMIEACGSVLSQEVCVDGSIEGEGSCTAPLECNDPPLYDCNLEEYCCNGNGTVEIGVTRGWNPSKSFGPFECGLNLSGRVFARLGADAEWGPDCECEETKISAELRVGLEVDGGASCSVEAFGFTVSVGANANACASAGGQGGTGCGLSLSPVAGASFSIEIEPVTIGWFEIGGYSREWVAGDGC